MDETNNINQLFEEGKKEMQSADTSMKNPISAIKSEWDRGQALPLTAQKLIAGGTVAYQVGKYLKNLKAVKDAIAQEEEAVRRLTTPAARNAKTGQGVGTQPFEKEGFRITQGGRYTEPAKTKKGTGTTQFRPPLVRPVGGTGEGLVRMAEEMPPWKQALKITAQDFASWLAQPDNFKQRATTPLIEIKGIKSIPTMEGERLSGGMPTRQTFIVTPADIAKGELPSTSVSAADLPADPARRTARLLRGLASGSRSVGGYIADKTAAGARSVASGARSVGGYIVDNTPSWVGTSARSVAPYVSPTIKTLGVGAYAANAINDPVKTVVEMGIPFTRFSGIGPVLDLGRGSDLQSRGSWRYPADGGEPYFVMNK